MAQEKRVIVSIEDELEIIDFIKLILERRGFEIIGVASGREGLETVRELKPDLVLLDLMMPGDMDGWAVYQAMQTDPVLKDTPVIVVTAKDQPIDKVLGIHVAKVDAYVTKPFSPQDLLDNVNRVLGLDDA
jgi:two-component system response regulator VicR